MTNEFENLDDELSQIEGAKTPLPNATAVLVLGICSLALLVFCGCYGIVGLILAIIGLALSVKPYNLYQDNPELYSDYKNLKAGRICSIIGLILNGLIFIVILILIFAGLADEYGLYG